MEHIKFPSIEQFRNVIKTVKQRSGWAGIEPPKLKFCGTVKLHGTNAGVAKKPFTGEVWYQSRERIITPEQDNAGFAIFAYSEKEIIDQIMNTAIGIYGNSNLSNEDTIVVFGEWCGDNIQNKVAICELPKMFVIFGVVVNHGESQTWFSKDQLKQLSNEISSLNPSEHRIFVSTDFKTWEIEIDFSDPQQVQNQLIDITLGVEQECPVGKHFGVSGVGEGVVWNCVDSHDVISTSGLIFKVKGEKHSDSKVKKLASVDIEKVNSIKQLAESFVTDHRLEKMLDLTLQEGLPLEPKTIPVFLKKVSDDIVKEELDTIAGNGFTIKEVVPNSVNLARKWILEKINSNLE